jgi:predicted TIM-barrel fold metal-dependent hydrolase
MSPEGNFVIDVHAHVGLKGDRYEDLGRFSAWYQRQLVYKIFLLYARVDETEVCDTVLMERTLEAIDQSGVDKVVCLALDHVFDEAGAPRPDKSHMWVSNNYIVDYLRPRLPDRILFGASVHPYDGNFENRVKKCVDDDAALMKWLPSAQHINLADDRTGKALEFLAHAGKGGKALPLLLHVGPEHAIFSTDPRTESYSYVRWTWKDKVANSLRDKKERLAVPQVEKIQQNLRKALDAGAVIIFAHCGLPYFFGGFLGRFLEHSDFKTVKSYLEETATANSGGACYADVSAICTPFRKRYFDAVEKLPRERLLFGSDFPTPVFELSADLKENLKDFKALLKGDFWRILVPQDNLIDVCHRELRYFFPGHPMFANFNRLL